MRFMVLAGRNFKENYLDLLSLSMVIIFPPALLLVLQTISTVDPFFSATNLAPGIVMFGFALLSLSSSMLLAKDRDDSLLARLLTSPLKASDFVLAYSLPYLPVIIFQTVVVFGVGFLVGLEINGNPWLAFLILSIMSIGYIGLGMILGTVFSYKTVSFPWIAINLLTIFSGAWFPLEFIGGPIQTSMNVLPFAHAIDSARQVIVNNAGFSDIAIDLYWVIGYTVVFFAAGVLLFRRRMAE